MYHSLNCRGRLLSLEQPQVMGILNLTPDSFSDGGKYNDPAAALTQTAHMIESGATIIDIGGYSTRPYASDISEEEETERIYAITRMILDRFPETFVSIDTFRSGVAREMLNLGAHMINDISAGTSDEQMLSTVAAYDAPYIAMHMQGTPRTMQQNPQYENIVEEIYRSFIQMIHRVREAGIRDLVLDPGFGFGKTVLHNYQLLGGLQRFGVLDIPLMAGISRKSMLYKLLNTSPREVTAAAAALHLKALEAGTRILRVHDVREAAQTVRLYTYMHEHGIV
jgi:dihydropteroate synthase